MRIIDNKKDYYDYLSGIYGIDELAVYDRRGSVTWSQYKEMFSVFWNPKRNQYDEFIPQKHERWRKPHHRFLCVEAGKRQFVILANRILPQESADMVKFEYSLLGTRLVNNKHSAVPLAVFEADLGCSPWLGEEWDVNELRYWEHSQWNFRKNGEKNDPVEAIVENPILDGSFITPLIPAVDIWKSVYEYISSLNDKDIVDNRPDSLKIESAGFDLKTSFRKMKIYLKNFWGVIICHFGVVPLLQKSKRSVLVCVHLSKNSC